MTHENYLSNITNTHFPLESKDLKLLEEKVQAFPLLSSKIYGHIPKCHFCPWNTKDRCRGAVGRLPHVIQDENSKFRDLVVISGVADITE